MSTSTNWKKKLLIYYSKPIVVYLFSMVLIFNVHSQDMNRKTG